MSALIEVNNRILEEIKVNLERREKFVEGPSFIDTSFTDVHNLISEEKKKAFDRLTDADLEKSMSYMEKYEDAIDKVN